MADDEYTDVTTTSWGSRIVGSFTGIIFGFLLFVAAFPLLWWNEGHSLHRIRTLDEGRNLVVGVAPDKADPANNGKLIHVSAQASTDDILQDALFGVRETALKLQRVVEVYEWKETQSTQTHKNLGGSETQETTYAYDRTWSEKRIDSSEFKHRDGHENPASMPYASEVFTAPHILVGVFKPASSFVAKINAFSDYPLSEQTANAMNASLKNAFKLNGTEYFYGDPATPQIGALRVHYRIIRPTEVSIIGKQNDSLIEPYYTRNGDIQLLAMGDMGADSMFAAAKDENMLMTWLIRLAGFILMWLGSSLVLRPIAVLGDVVPFIGSIAGAGIGLVTGLVSLAASICVIAIAWLAYRPLIGGTLLVVAAGLLFGGGTKLIQKAKAELPHKK